MKLTKKTLKLLQETITGDIKNTPYRSGPLLVELFNEFCKYFVIIASPDGAPEIEKQLLRIKQISNFRILIQSQPNGMGDAIWQARNIVKTPCTLVVWGDQVHISNDTFKKVLSKRSSEEKDHVKRVAFLL